jgi:uncharacterized protein YndB with AHSA1/START domain
VTRINVSTTIDAPPEAVWAAIDDVRTHPQWMQDAVSVVVTSDRQQGVGTTFDCQTKVGPFRLLDRMEITEWTAGQVMGVRHVGLVAGTGRFTLEGVQRGRTRFTWCEQLQFPWWMGGPLVATAGKPVLLRIWARNLRNLRELVEAGA